MIKKFIIAFLVSIVSLTSVWAQEEDPAKWDRIRAIKVDFINERMHFSGDQSAKFWPIYQSYQSELRTVRRGYIDAYMKAHAGAPRDEGRASLEGNLEFQSKELELKKKYKDRLLQVISPQQLDQLYIVEREFKRTLLQQLKNGQK